MRLLIGDYVNGTTFLNIDDFMLGPSVRPANTVLR